MMHSVQVYPAFRLLMIGTLATNTAFWMYQVAVGWLALELTDSPFFVGLSGFAGGIPMLILSLPAGVLIDRFDGRRVLLIAQAGIMLVAGLFAIMVGFDLIEPWSLLVLAAAYGSVMSFVFPSRTTIVPFLVERKDLSNAIALNSATQNSTRVIGPSVAGVLIATVGISGTFALAAALQVFALYTTYHLPSTNSGPDSKRRLSMSSLTVGLKIVANSPFLLGLILLALAPTVLVMPYINLMPVFARDVMGLGSGGLGLAAGRDGSRHRIRGAIRRQIHSPADMATFADCHGNRVHGFCDAFRGDIDGCAGDGVSVCGRIHERRVSGVEPDCSSTECRR